MAPSHGRGTTPRVNPHRAPLAEGGAGAAAGSGRGGPLLRGETGRETATKRAWAGAVLLALALHTWLLGAWMAQPGPRPSLAPADVPAPARRVVVQTRPAEAAPARTAEDLAPRPEGAQPARPAVLARVEPAVPPPSARTIGARAATPSAAGASLNAVPARGAGARQQDERAEVEPAADERGEPARDERAEPARVARTGGVAAYEGKAAPRSEGLPPPPTYRTTPPPSATLIYDVRRGQAEGSALVRWQLGPDGRYLLEMQGSGATPALTPHWTSRGALDADGVAPERFAVARRGRERHAANFRRDAGLVSFAGPTGTWPLLAGAQDRLSWMVQLAAVLEADPALATPGERISMMVVGAHGDAGLWTFTVQPMTVTGGPAGEAWAVWPLRREAGPVHDPQVEVWVAPALHHLPVRVRLTLPSSGESTEMRLRALQAP